MTKEPQSCTEWPYDLFDEMETAYEDARRSGDERMAKSLEMLGVSEPHPPPKQLMCAWQGLHGDIAALCEVSEIFRKTFVEKESPLACDLTLYWLELAAAKMLARPECPKIREDDVISAIDAFVQCPRWASTFLCAPNGARWRLALSFYFSEYVNTEDNPNRPMPDFPVKEYRIVRKALEAQLTLKDLDFLIHDGNRSPAGIRHFKAILKKKIGR